MATAGILALSAIRTSLHLGYPPTCSSCETLVKRAGHLCTPCRRLLRELRRPGCTRCGAPVAGEGSPCPWCLGKGIYPFRSIARLGLFDGPLKTMIHRMKYHRQWPIAEHLADRLLDRPQVRSLLAAADWIVPVPLYFWRRLFRGYNQAELIARRLARASGKPVLRAVRRIRDTDTQTRFTSQQERRDNVKDAFALRTPRGIENSRIVVVDDVLTSGATLQEVARCLKKANPAALSAIVVAVADPRRRGFTKV